MGSSSSTSPLSLKILLISTGVLTTAVTVKLYLPPALTSTVIWSVILSYLQPPYLYFIINAIILTIVVSSRYHNPYNHRHNQSRPLLSDESNALDPPSGSLLPLIQPSFDDFKFDFDFKPPAVSENESEAPVKDSGTVTGEGEAVVSRSVWKPSPEVVNAVPSETVTFPVREKPLVASRFSRQRKLTKINPEGVRTLRVAKPRKHETLETTWKTITAGRHIPLTRHLRKPDVFGNELNDYRPDELNRTLSNNSVTSSGGKLRKEGSPSQDELTRRVEAFINNFNEEMRLEREESLKRYREMINRGVE